MEDRKIYFDPQKKLDSAHWNVMSITDLWHQKILLQERIDVAMRMGKIDMQRQLEKGMMTLMSIIKIKGDKEFDPKNPSII